MEPSAAPATTLATRVMSAIFVAGAALALFRLAPGRDYRDGSRGALAFLVAAAAVPHALLLFRTT